MAEQENSTEQYVINIPIPCEVGKMDVSQLAQLKMTLDRITDSIASVIRNKIQS